MKPWALYILRCQDGSFYTGITTDFPRRLRQHNQGRASKYTRARRPVVALYLSSMLSHSQALREEARIKKLSRAAKWELVDQQGKAGGVRWYGAVSKRAEYTVPKSGCLNTDG